ncbi:N5-glutamine methyltransferase, modifies release factors RF-1 and RF-2 [Crenothrix polyspora]|uniref:Release factor glutamine methyltransferase n=1 Tax=Crenothrix polyspora TaxID=360316 RepID=A0A1R4HFS4_9GAMM|nr:peptide chain release factor N(5)-glutamine methyltransferase [Crenothrix polyspora]SJM95073.1 N5-glutamine methyltransferase, modifies release factors RF-1 and RF-2 [Crenothrix polyspora]
MTSIQTILEQATQMLATSSDSATLDAEVLLCSILQKQRSHLRAWPDKILDARQADLFWAAVAKRQQGQPIAYITGNREFWSRSFQVSSDVLIPRPDTEVLIECALKLIPVDQAARIIDLGTGSGIIAITLAAERPQANVTATDISEAALAIAQSNAKQHDIDRIQFYTSNWFSHVPLELFDLIVSNPPYIAEGDPHLQDSDLRFEPQTALVAPDNGLQAIQSLADQARHRLQLGGHLLIEHGYNQQDAVQNIFKEFRYENVQTYLDLSGQPRVTYGQWNP